MTRPGVGFCSPAAMLKIVLLPQPDGPIRLTKRPAGTDSVTWASASNAPAGVAKVMLTSSMRSFGEARASPAPPAGADPARLRKLCARKKSLAISAAHKINVSAKVTHCLEFGPLARMRAIAGRRWAQPCGAGAMIDPTMRLFIGRKHLNC